MYTDHQTVHLKCNKTQLNGQDAHLASFWLKVQDKTQLTKVLFISSILSASFHWEDKKKRVKKKVKLCIFKECNMFSSSRSCNMTGYGTRLRGSKWIHTSCKLGTANVSTERQGRDIYLIIMQVYIWSSHSRLPG